MTVVAMITFHAAEGAADSLLALLGKAQRGVIKAGCKKITLLRDQDEPDVVYEFEEWDEPAAHQRMVSAAEKAGAFEPIKALLKKPMNTAYLAIEKETVAGA